MSTTHQQYSPYLILKNANNRVVNADLQYRLAATFIRLIDSWQDKAERNITIGLAKSTSSALNPFSNKSKIIDPKKPETWHLIEKIQDESEKLSEYANTLAGENFQALRENSLIMICAAVENALKDISFVHSICETGDDLFLSAFLNVDAELKIKNQIADYWVNRFTYKRDFFVKSGIHAFLKKLVLDKPSFKNSKENWDFSSLPEDSANTETAFVIRNALVHQAGFSRGTIILFDREIMPNQNIDLQDKEFFKLKKSMLHLLESIWLPPSII